MRRLRRGYNRTPRWEQLLYRICDLLGIGWETSEHGRLRLRDGNPPKGTVLNRLDLLEARVAELESDADEGRRSD